ncbi:MAG: gliding motility-associated C-terminal domain-containing protein [Flavobacteriales bacterium]
MRFILKTALPMCLSIICGFTSWATHISGGELNYIHLEGNVFEIELIIYRDCGSTNTLGTGFDEQAQVGVYNNSTILTTLDFSLDEAELSFLTVDTECLNIPSNLCVQRAVYLLTEEFPPIIGGYDLVYQRCCRTPALVNLSDIVSQGITLHSRIPGLNTPASGINNSAAFNSLPPLAICINESFVFDHSASDLDGDSLVYELCTPLQGGTDNMPIPSPPSPPPFLEVLWADGFSTENQITGSADLQIDSETGLITLVPELIGRFATCICVKEFRDGELINTNYRDFQYTVTTCSSNTAAISVPDPCAGLQVEFDGSSSSSDMLFWDFGDLNNSQDTSSLLSPMHTYSEFGTYTVTLISDPGLLCADTAYFELNITSLEALINDVIFECVNGIAQFTFSGSSDYEEGSTFVWNFPSGFNESVINDSVAVQNSPLPGTYDVYYTVNENGCEDTAVTSVTIDDLEPGFYLSQDTLVWPSNTVGIFSTSSSEECYYVLGNGLESAECDLMASYSSPGIYEICQLVVSPNNCIKTENSSLVILDGISVPNVFSPDFDGTQGGVTSSGLNEVFHVIHLDYIKSASLNMYNRWGNLVYENTSYSNRAPFKGLDQNGNELAEGVYFYVLHIDDHNQSYSGTLTLLKRK